MEKREEPDQRWTTIAVSENDKCDKSKNKGILVPLMVKFCGFGKRYPTLYIFAGGCVITNSFDNIYFFNLLKFSETFLIPFNERSSNVYEVYDQMLHKTYDIPICLSCTLCLVLISKC